MKVFFYSIVFIIMILGLTCFGQVSKMEIDESILKSFQDSITPVKIELCKITFDSSNTLSPENFNKFLDKSVKLEKEEIVYLDNAFNYRNVIGDSVISSYCNNLNYAIRLTYRDGMVGIIGVSFQGNRIVDYNSRYGVSETTTRFIRVLREMFDKYEL